MCPGAAVTSDHKLNILKQQKVILSRFWSQKSQIEVSQDHSREAPSCPSSFWGPRVPGRVAASFPSPSTVALLTRAQVPG